ncbi:Exonuclease SbcC CDS [Bradyrhizobium sp.]|uniref:AAA family ATPase n=1 Tax=Bradyrhizobium sp. TaxID=376 RepID=UPI0007C1C347|nr:SMC family ATPase [Bradyrhizobium sp.]CUU16265.1 Exonuclease SbcC CDS [Bradyrhizobium sp.]
MRPLRLTMQAFGPYANLEVIDFREAISAQLFGIYGQTGSGKSTVFSAMTFALFGKSAKEEQSDTTSLRSDRADPGLLTSVEFVFEVGDRRYVVRRQPEQMRPKQRGAGETKVSHEAWLFDATGLALEDITGENPGKVLAERKVDQVRAEIKQLLGYEVEQFRQIVLLPQGKFESFLAANTTDRKEILRELFDVDLYRRLTDDLKVQAAAVDREVRNRREVCAGRLNAAGYDGLQALDGGIRVAEAAREDARTAEQQAIEQRDRANEVLGAARVAEEKFGYVDRAKGKVVELEHQADKFDALRQQVQNAEIARSLTDVEAHHRRALKDETDLRAKRDLRQRGSEKARATKEEAVGLLQAEEARASETEQLRVAVENLRRYVDTLGSAATITETVGHAVKTLIDVTRKATEASRHVGELKAARDKCQQQRLFASEKAARRIQLQGQRNDVAAALKAALDFERATKVSRDAQTELVRCETLHETAGTALDDARLAYETAEEELSGAQALHLAIKLALGEPCPVCGSREHPSPATGSPEYQGLDDAFRTTKSAWQSAQTREQECRSALVVAQTTAKMHEQTLSAMEPPGKSAVDHQSRMSEIDAEIAALGQEADPAAIQAALDGIASKLADTERLFEQTQIELGEAQQEDAAAKARLDQALSSVPLELRQREALDRSLTDTRRRYEERLKAHESARRHKDETASTALIAERDAMAAIEAYHDAVGRRDAAQIILQQRLAEKKLSEADYQSFKRFIPSIDADTVALAEFARSLNLARDGLAKALKAVEGLERLHLESLASAFTGAQRLATEATERRVKAEKNLESLETLWREIDREQKRLDAIEQESEPLRELAGLFSGGNTSKLELETFAIAAMFDRVLDAANRRLRPMTKDRYRLQRDEGGSGKSYRGLGIGVFDLETGKVRLPSTLSGGETFIAALALALGLSDVVESVSGKVHLDTIFIDEGFGSLDTDDEAGTLEQVLQVLTQLVSPSRAIGIISHVRAVQERIPNGFYVHKDIGSSRIEARGVI